MGLPSLSVSLESDCPVLPNDPPMLPGWFCAIVTVENKRTATRKMKSAMRYMTSPRRNWRLDINRAKLDPAAGSSDDRGHLNEPGARALVAGDYVFIPARKRHRVESTDPQHPTVWLAIHFE